MQRDAAEVAAYKRSGDWGETTVGDAVAGWARTKPDADAFVTVTADGTIHVVDASTEPDLFWAIRGGGGNFGVVTRLKYRLHPLPAFTGGLSG